VELLWTLPLEGTDSSVEILLGYDPLTGTGIVSWHGEWKSFDTAPTANPVGVWRTAASHSAWPVDNLEVLLLSEDETKGGGGTAAKATSPADAERLQAAIQRFLNRRARTCLRMNRRQTSEPRKERPSRFFWK
jgi:hypothetical protein